MVTAYIFVTLKAGSMLDVDSKIFKQKFIVDVNKLYGKFDLVVKVRFKNLSELQKFIKKLRSLKDVEDTTTMIAVE